MPACLRGGILKITESLRSHPAMEISVYLLYVISPLHAENSEIIKKKNNIFFFIISCCEFNFRCPCCPLVFLCGCCFLDRCICHEVFFVDVAVPAVVLAEVAEVDLAVADSAAEADLAEVVLVAAPAYEVLVLFAAHYETGRYCEAARCEAARCEVARYCEADAVCFVQASFSSS